MNDLKEAIQFLNIVSARVLDKIEKLPAEESTRRFFEVPPARLKKADLRSMAEVEREHILNVLVACDDNRSEAARILGIDRRTLYRKLNEFRKDDIRDTPADDISREAS